MQLKEINDAHPSLLLNVTEKLLGMWPLHLAFYLPIGGVSFLL
jgi:hypothetical protein